MTARLSVLPAVWVALALLAAAPPGLEPVPEPGPAAVEDSVRRQLAAAHRSVLDLSESGDDPAALARAYGELGRLYAAYELWDAARPSFVNAVALAAGPAGGRWRHYLGYVLERGGDLREARRHYEEAAAADPRDRAAALRGAEAELALGRTAEAERSFRRLAAEPGFEAAARFGLGRALERRGDLAGAIAELRRVLELQPAATRARYALAQAYRRAGRAEEARRQIAAIGTAGSEGPVVFPDPLIGSLAKAARGGAFHKFQGDQAVQAGRLADAAAAYRRAVEAEPGSFSYRKSLGLTLYRLGQAAEAARELEAALALEPDLPPAQVPGETARLRYTLGGIAANQPGGGGRDTALDSFREAARLDPGYADAHLQTGNLLGAAGRLEEALAAFDRAVAADPRHLEARLQRATTLMDLGRFAEAIPDLEHRLELVPGDANAHRLLAIARDRAGGQRP